MSIHKLHIFAKNRDAVAAQKGYSYQQLKTLEDWLENRITGGSEDIYCDFEDDIFSRDLFNNKTTFKQIKLYSTDFSFSSESIKKALSHFFTLYTKGEYSFDQIEFHFETNVSVVGTTVKDNDAALLEEWHNSQEDISLHLLERIRVRVKKILGEYIYRRYEELKNNVLLKSDLQIAKNIYENLKNEDFDAFIQSIKWKFDSEETNKALASILSRIQELIPKIPLPLNDGNTAVYSALLVNEVFQRSIKDDPEERKLTKELLDMILLNAGEEEDKWYAEIIQQFNGFAVQHFYQGEFQTVIDGARYCRSRQLDDTHTLRWLALLNEYINLDETPLLSKRKAIYEYCFLKISYNIFYQSSSGDLVGDEYFINYYFENWKGSSSVQIIEDDIILLQLIKSQIKGLGVSIPEDHIVKWENNIKTYLELEVSTEKNIDRLCELLEMQGHLAHQSAIFDPAISYQTAFEYYRRIPPLLEKAHYYSLARLYAQMQQMVKILTENGLNDELLELTDQFMSEIEGYGEKTGLRHKSAHEMIERAVLHIEHHDLPNYLKALELLQKAKEKWRLEYTKEGYILSLLGIARVYEGLGMSYASKYYALITLWTTWHTADPTLYKHLSKAFLQILHLDYIHGAWINAINDFNLYLIAKREFDQKGLELSDDESFNRAVIETAFIIHAAPLIHPPVADFIDLVKSSMGYVWNEYLQPADEVVSNILTDLEALKRVLNQKLIDKPLNDLGLIRNICFTALNIEWLIQFNNNDILTSIGEEFVSCLQITLCEIARIKQAILKSKERIFITIQKGHFQKKLIESNNWIINIPEFNSKEETEIQMHYSYIGMLILAVLQEVSVLSKNEFSQFYFDELLDKGKLGVKALEASSYQRIFQNTVGSPFELTMQKSNLPSFENKNFFRLKVNWLSKNL